MSQSQAQPESGTAIYLRLLSYIRGYELYLVYAFIAFALFAACDAALAWWMKQLVNAINLQETDMRWYLSMLVIVIFTIRGFSNIAGNYATEYVSRQVVNKMRRQLFSHVLMLPCSYFNQTNSGNLLTKLVYNIENVSSASTNALRIVVKGGLTILFLLAYMIYLNWKLSLIFLTVTPIMAGVIFYITLRIRSISHRIQYEIGKVGSRASEAIRGHRIVKIYSGYNHENNKFTRITNNDLEQRLKLVLTNNSSGAIVQLLFAVSMSFLIILAMQPSILAEMSTGEFISFITATGFISRPIQQLTQVNSIIQQGIAAAESVFEVVDLDIESVSKEKDNTTTALRYRGDVRFENIGFHYSDTQKQGVLHSINLSVKAGTSCAIVGLSGSGKTTMVSLIPQFFLPTTGNIFIDETAVNALPLEQLRANIALVTQETLLFDDSIYNNIAYGELRYKPREEVLNAAYHAQVMEFAENLPDGLDTQIGESGNLLSGGQRQRISIARAFLKDSPILILDEATSALDSRSENLIQKALEGLMQNRTCFVIAHRLSTIEKADNIIVLDNGSIAEQGTHEELINQPSIYANLYHKQFQ